VSIPNVFQLDRNHHIAHPVNGALSRLEIGVALKQAATPILATLYDTIGSQKSSHNTRPIYRCATCAQLSQGKEGVIDMCDEYGPQTLTLESCRAIYVFETKGLRPMWISVEAERYTTGGKPARSFDRSLYTIQCNGQNETRQASTRGAQHSNDSRHARCVTAG
jgi:hypothetical protein